MTVTKQGPRQAGDSPEKCEAGRDPRSARKVDFEVGGVSVGDMVKASWVPGSETIAHGKGVSYAGELPRIAVSQAIELTDLHNRPA